MMAGRSLLVIALLAGATLVAGCSSTSNKRSSGYYKDDGPGSNIPANIQSIPDAVPRIEVHSRGTSRPYVIFGKRYVPLTGERAFRQEGRASWYGRKFHGNKTANGETYDMYAMTAAHPTLPIPSYARVTRAGSDRSVIVRINDRGPFHSTRIIDLSYAAAAKLDLIKHGSGQVIIEAITNADIARAQAQGTDFARSSPATQPVVAAATPSVPNALAVLEQPSQVSVQPVLVSHNHTPQPAGSATPQVSATSAASGVFLQFGAFGAQESALSLAERLNQQIGVVESRQAHIQPAGDLYRVQIGPYASRTEAVNAALRIQEQTGRQSTMAIR